MPLPPRPCAGPRPAHGRLGPPCACRPSGSCPSRSRHFSLGVGVPLEHQPREPADDIRSPLLDLYERDRVGSLLLEAGHEVPSTVELDVAQEDLGGLPKPPAGELVEAAPLRDEVITADDAVPAVCMARGDLERAIARATDCDRRRIDPN